ncbi:MAG: transporter substrate-binding domain-containing protein [Clostridia bacterium]|nr:transporter substrate-binding domain-containing protein [Clostridia bacterium]
MKKRTLLLSLFLCLSLALGGCGAKDAETTNDAKDTLTVAMECSYAPYNWTQKDASNGAVPIKDSSDFAFGYDVMMAKHIAEKIGMNLEIVKSDWDSLVPAVQSGIVDCVIAGQSITSERMQSVDFTKPYYYASIVALVKSDGKYANAAGVSDLAGATCTSQLNTVWYDVCLPQIKDANILAAQDTAPAMLVALKAGTCDLIVTDMPTAMAACATDPSLKLLDFTGSDDNFEVSDEEINIGISLQKGNTELADKINGVLSEMTEDDFKKMMSDAIAVQPLSN